jgi:hypothetical protein
MKVKMFGLVGIGSWNKGCWNLIVVDVFGMVHRWMTIENIWPRFQLCDLEIFERLEQSK